MVFKRVDLPQPDGPTSTRKPPRSTARSMPCSTCGGAEALDHPVDLEKGHLGLPQPLTAPAIRPRTK